MCLATGPKVPPPLPAPPAPPPTATAVEPNQELQRRRKRGGSDLESLRVPLNPTGQPNPPRVGL